VEDSVELLRRWLKRVRESSLAHYAAEEYYSRLHYYVGLPASVLAAIVGTTVFASLDAAVDVKLKFLVGLISVLTAISTGLQTFLRYPERAERHRKAAGEYAAIRREIERNLVFPDHAKFEVVDQIRKRIDGIGADAPNVPARLWALAKQTADQDFFLSKGAKAGQLGSQQSPQ
jgi:hypothetical protein